jgi:precorrin-6B methylase 2
MTANCRDSRYDVLKTEKLMATSFNVAGIKKGMKVGEVGAGKDRVAVQLAQRVSSSRKVYANS